LNSFCSLQMFDVGWKPSWVGLDKLLSVCQCCQSYLDRRLVLGCLLKDRFVSCKILLNNYDIFYLKQDFTVCVVCFILPIRSSLLRLSVLLPQASVGGGVYMRYPPTLIFLQVVFCYTDGRLTPRQTGRLTVGHKLTSTVT
jgi:hypothetical protein